jgi:hypothetical protein
MCLVWNAEIHNTGTLDSFHWVSSWILITFSCSSRFYHFVHCRTFGIRLICTLICAVLPTWRIADETAVRYLIQDRRLSGSSQDRERPGILYRWLFYWLPVASVFRRNSNIFSSRVYIRPVYLKLVASQLHNSGYSADFFTQSTLKLLMTVMTECRTVLNL